MDTSGHADELRGFLRALETTGHEPAVRDLRWTDASAGLSAAETEQIERQKRRTPARGEPLVAVHEYLPNPNQITVPNAVNVKRVMFETDRIPEHWVSPMMDRDELWVPSEFNVETFARSGIPREKLKILGGTLNFDSFAPGAEPWDLGAPEGVFTFLTNFDFSERKGWKQLLRGWAKAFDRSDDVCLVLKTGSFYTDDGDVMSRIESFLRQEFGAGATDRLAPILFLTDRLPTAAMPRLYAAADAYVLPSRGEGWGRPYMEALAMGLPTIASRFSGNLEFMDDDTSWLIDGELVPVPENADLWTAAYRGHKWFEADADELAAAMREIVSDPDAARAKAAPARAELIRRFSYGATANRIAELSADAIENHGDLRSRPVYAAVRGPAGSVDSLAIGNDAITRHLIGRGYNVRVRAAHGADQIQEDVPGLSQSWPPNFDPVTEGPTIMILHWEFGPPPKEWLEEVCRKVDRVWVASDYVRRGYVEGGMPPGIVEVNPFAAEVDRFTPEGPKYPLPRQAGTTFLFVGGTTWRKGADILLNAWREAFGPDDDVQLVVKDNNVHGVYRGQTAGPEFKALADDDSVAPVIYIDDELPFEELPSLYRAADVVVLPYRAEGFCLPAVEAMACGVPVIHNGSGPTGEFVADIGGWALPAERAGIPVEARLPELAAPGYVHEVGQAALVETMRAVAADPEARRERGSRGIEQARGYTWKAFVDRTVEKLEALQREGLPLARVLRRAEIEARSSFVVYAPDWGDEAAWGTAIDAWLDTFSDADDVTLALYVDGDADAIGARIMGRLAGRDESQLPDLALVVPSSVSLIALAASADAVLTDGSTDPASRPQLLRRARRIVPAADTAALSALREEI